MQMLDSLCRFHLFICFKVLACGEISQEATMQRHNTKIPAHYYATCVTHNMNVWLPVCQGGVDSTKWLFYIVCGGYMLDCIILKGVPVIVSTSNFHCFIQCDSHYTTKSSNFVLIYSMLQCVKIQFIFV